MPPLPPTHPQGVVLIGAGGHAKVIADMLLAAPEWTPIGCTDRREGSVLQLPVLGGDEILPDLYRQGLRYAIVAIGDNKKRLSAAARVSAIGYRFACAVSTHAYLAASAVIQPGAAVMAGAVIQPEASIGSHAIINTGATVDHECIVEEGAHLGPGVHLAGQVHIGRGAFLGMGVKVIPNVQIGAGSIIGAGAVVLRDVPAHCLAVGVPARIIKRRDEWPVQELQS